MKRSAIMVLLMIGFGGGTMGQAPPQKLPDKTRILFLLDGSGSMLARWENTYRIAVAKKLLTDLVDSLRVDEKLELALRVYGHQFDRRLGRCDDTRLEVPFARSNHNQIIDALKNIGPKGTTPIAYALEQAAGDFPKGNEARNIIIIITDGIESCDGDPCAVSMKLQKQGILLKPFVIGIGLNPDYQSQFGCMGTFFDASNITDFKEALDKALVQSLSKTSVAVELLDDSNRPTVSNINVSFINHFTQTSAFEFVHYRDENGRPDTVQIDPVLTYDVVVNTLPPVRKDQVNIIPGKHNTVKIQAPQGSLKLQQRGVSEYDNGVTVLVKRPKNGEIITTFSMPGSAKLLVGTYDIVCTTLPRRVFPDTRIVQNETFSLEIPQPGVVNFIATAYGIGSIYEMHEDGSQSWVHNLDAQKLRNIVAIQPGRYKVVFRSLKAKGSKYTTITKFEVKSGSSFNISL
jgi:Ca-activated chloride channel family protein